MRNREIKKWMRDTGTLQAELAKMLGISQASVSRALAGARRWTKGERVLLERAVGVRGG